MTVKAILTGRELKNKVTGLDLYVSDYQEIPHKVRNTFLYHVIVVTDLFYYKTKEQKQSDVVQFMISKTFEEFEELYQKLFKRFPSVNFPSLPKFSIANKTEERLHCMDKVMKLVASTQKLSCSTMVISFLKGDAEKTKPVEETPSGEAVKTRERESISSQFVEEQSDVSDGKPALSKSTEDENLFDVDSNRNGDNSHIDDLEGEISSLTVESNTSSIQTAGGQSSLFDDDVIQENQAEDGLFTPPSDARKSAFEKTYDFDDDEDEDLLDVKDDLDDLLSLSRSSEKQSAIKAQKPSLPPRPKSGSVNISDLADEDKDGIFQRQKSHSLVRKENPLKECDSSTLDDIFSKNKKKGLFDDDDDDDLFASTASTKPTDSSTTADIESMGQEDIMNYIQSN